VYAQRSGLPDDRPAAVRDQIDRLLRLADDLDPADRALIRSIYDRGMSAGELARAIGRTPRTVNRRLERLVRRVSNPAYRFILRERRSWPAVRRRVAELVFLRGGTQRAAATATGLSLHQTRREIERIRVLIDEGLAAERSASERRSAPCAR
jgi:DNA-directed RNA polymerase specialized sigma24 family protein